MILAEDLWLRRKSAQQSILHIINFQSAVIGTATLQAVRLSLTLPTDVMVAFARAGTQAPPPVAPATLGDMPKPTAEVFPFVPAPATEAIVAPEPTAPSAPEPAATKAPVKIKTKDKTGLPATPKPKPSKAKAKAKVKPSATTATPETAAVPGDVVAVVAAADDGPNPHLLDAPRKGGADDLTALKGVGAKLAETLNEFGIYHYDQIAGLNDEGIDWLNEQQSGFKMICCRYDLVGQAKAIASTTKSRAKPTPKASA